MRPKPKQIAIAEAAIALVNDVRQRHPEVDQEGYGCPFMQKLAELVLSCKDCSEMLDLCPRCHRCPQHWWHSVPTGMDDD